MLDIWPALPIYIYVLAIGRRPRGMANIIVALKQHDLVCKIHIDGIPNSLLKKFATMKKPFPALTSLRLWSKEENALLLPDSFLGASAPRLRSLDLSGIPFPALPKLLLSTHDLAILHLWEIPHSGYISPGTMVACLSGLSRLESLYLVFRFPRLRVHRASRIRPPLTRVVLPALTSFDFKGNSEYLEDMVSRIDSPRLSYTHITFLNQLVFDTPLLRNFISRTETFKVPHRADVLFSNNRVEVSLFRRKETADHRMLEFRISCKPSDWQLSSIAHVCSSSLPRLSTLEHLGIYENRFSKPQWRDDMENTQWLELLYPFFAVKDLVLSEKLVQLIAPALQDLTEERVTEVLPALQNLVLQGPEASGPVEDAIGRFIAARQLSGHLVTVHHQERR